jgi:cell division transport system permease protein
MTPLKNAWHHIRRSPFQSLIAITVMTISFFSLSFFVIISHGMSSVLNYFETKPEVTIFLKDGLDQSTVQGLQKELSDYPNIREIKFISKDQALQIYKEQNKNNPMLTEMVTASILPASFEVSVSDPKILEQIAQNFSTKTAQVDEIIYQKDIINSLLVWTDFIRKTGIVVVSVTTAITLLIITVIIGLKITNRKEEISISRLLGAGNFYVKRPFLIEGIIYGLTGSILGLLVTFSLSAFFFQKINLFFSPVVFINSDLSFYAILLLCSLTLGSLIGFLASWIGVKRNIKF